MDSRHVRPSGRHMGSFRAGALEQGQIAHNERDQHP
jgi:hypothetical protein